MPYPFESSSRWSPMRSAWRPPVGSVGNGATARLTLPRRPPPPPPSRRERMRPRMHGSRTTRMRRRPLLQSRPGQNSRPTATPNSESLSARLCGMCKRILILLAVILMATGCAHGARQTQASSPPNLQIAPGLLRLPADELPQPENGSRSALLGNHVQAAREYHRLRIDYRGLVCSVTGQGGITINGLPPRRPDGCAESGADR